MEYSVSTKYRTAGWLIKRRVSGIINYGRLANNNRSQRKKTCEDDANRVEYLDIHPLATHQVQQQDWYRWRQESIGPITKTNYIQTIGESDTDVGSKIGHPEDTVERTSAAQNTKKLIIAQFQSASGGADTSRFPCNLNLKWRTTKAALKEQSGHDKDRTTKPQIGKELKEQSAHEEDKEFKEDDTDVTPEMQEVEREFQLLEDIVGQPENFGLSTGNTVGLKVEQLDNAVDQPDNIGEQVENDDDSSSSSSSSSNSGGSDNDSDSDSDSDDSSETVYYTTAYYTSNSSDDSTAVMGYHKEPDTRDKWASSVICYWCQEKGHKAYQYPLRQAYHPKVASRPNNGSNNESNNGSNNRN
eukprot:jgi/Psemu1/23497/gm1.23497_g